MDLRHLLLDPVPLTPHSGLKRVAVLASDSVVSAPDELTVARRVARRLAGSGVTVVDCGEALGPAGTVTTEALAAGGRVASVPLNGAPPTPTRPGHTIHRTVDDVTAQRDAIRELADAWLVLPGAVDRLDDLTSLGSGGEGRELPVGLLDDGGYYSRLLTRATDAALDWFVRESQRGAVVLARDLDELLARLAEYQPPETRRGALI